MNIGFKFLKSDFKENDLSSAKKESDFDPLLKCLILVKEGTSKPQEALLNLPKDY